ncbi:type I-D CRISPR-associated protein Cas5/Csc1 [Methanosarcinales archaeon]|nr:MAG: type I-D CRISPR-associated protein Cas5/Csc1 [Methanosarcinales archaeon]
MRVFRYILCPHDFFFYVSRELEEGVPSDVISNTALLYAFNTHAQVHRNASGNVPHYDEDVKKFTLYSTPAELLNENRVVIGGKLLKSEVSRELVRITYNSVQTVTQSVDVGKVCFPMMGKYLKYRPLVPFYGFLIGGRSSSLIRIGKKLVPARVYYEEVEEVKVREGRFKPSHPVNVNDLPPETRLVRGKIQMIPPTPIYTECVLEGKYVEGKCGGNRCTLALPDAEKYPEVGGL